MRNIRTITLTVLALVLAGCGGAATDTTVDAGAQAVTTVGADTTAAADTTAVATTMAAETTEATTEDTTDDTTDDSTDDSAAAGMEIGTAESDLGTILVDAEGRTLYAFLADADGEPTCAGDCAEAWPALTGTASAGEGVDDSLLSTVDALEGGTQVKYGDWPLYYYFEDEAAGDTKGQGIGDVWFVIGPDGEPIEG
jgi:predicted lipoprotein with Yx(FWY)xxD motif